MKYIKSYTSIINEYNNTKNLNNFYNINVEDIITETFLSEFKKSDEYDRLYEEFEYGKDSDKDSVEFEEFVLDKLNERFYRAESAIGDCIKTDGTIDIWREMRVNNNWYDIISNGDKPLGIYWTYDENSTEAYWEDNIENKKKDDVYVIIKVNVKQTIVNWKETFETVLTGYGEDEKEIRLFEKTPLNIIEIIEKNTDFQNSTTKNINLKFIKKNKFYS